MLHNVQQLITYHSVLIVPLVLLVTVVVRVIGCTDDLKFHLPNICTNFCDFSEHVTNGVNCTNCDQLSQEMAAK